MSSVLNQQFHDFEYIIIDGASSDRTLDICNSIKDPRLSVYSCADKGIYDAFNIGVNKSSGEYVAFVHSDDLFAHTNVLSAVASKIKQERCDVIYSDLALFSINRKYMRQWSSGQFSQLNLRLGWTPPHPTLFVSKRMLLQVGEYNLQYTISSDYDYIFRLFETPDLKVSYLNQTTYFMTAGGASSGSFGKQVTKIYEDLLIAKKYTYFWPVTVILKKVRKLFQFKMGDVY